MATPRSTPSSLNITFRAPGRTAGFRAAGDRPTGSSAVLCSTTRKSPVRGLGRGIRSVCVRNTAIILSASLRRANGVNET